MWCSPYQMLEFFLLLLFCKTDFQHHFHQVQPISLQCNYCIERGIRHLLLRTDRLDTGGRDPFQDRGTSLDWSTCTRLSLLASVLKYTQYSLLAHQGRTCS